MPLPLSTLMANLSEFVLWSLVAVVIVGAICIAYGILVERRWYRLAVYRLPILPPGSPSRLTVLHLSDLHLVASDRGMARHLASRPAAHITKVTGNVHGEPDAEESVAAALSHDRGNSALYFDLRTND